MLALALDLKRLTPKLPLKFSFVKAGAGLPRAGTGGALQDLQRISLLFGFDTENAHRQCLGSRRRGERGYGGILLLVSASPLNLGG